MTGAKVAPSKQKEQEIEAPPPRNPYLIDPNSEFQRKWDFVTIFLLAFVMTVTPFEVAFLSTAINVLFVINRLMDLFFITDLVMQFFLMYRDEDGRLIKDQKMIIKRYIKCWLWIDTVSVLPFDMLGVIYDSDEINKFKALRIIRLFRLAKLLRILRAGRMFDRWESAVAVNYSMLTLGKFVFLTVIVAHWMACAWHMIKIIEDDTTNNWVIGYLGSDHDLNTFEIYICALYWAVMTMSTIGYGDVVAKTTSERVVATMGMFIGSSIFAYIVGAVTGTVATMGARKTEFHELMDAVNGYMEEVQLPNPVRMRIREYFRHRFNTGTLHSNSRILELMSPALRESVATHTHAGWIRDIPYFAKCNNEFVVKVALSLEHRTFAPHETVIYLYEDTDILYIVKAGVCACKGMIFTRGKVFGEDMITSIVKPSECKRYYTARSLTFSDVYTLMKHSLTELLDKYQETYTQVRRLALKTVFRECILSYNNAVKNLMTGQRKFSGNRQLVEQFESKLARLLPTEGEEEPEAEDEETKQEEEPLGAEGKIITAELRRMTDALRTMQERVISLEKSSRNAPQTAGGAPDPFVLERLAVLEKQLQDVLGGSAAGGAVITGDEAQATAADGTSAEWAMGAPASASFASPKK